MEDDPITCVQNNVVDTDSKWYTQYRLSISWHAAHYHSIYFGVCMDWIALLLKLTENKRKGEMLTAAKNRNFKINHLQNNQ